MHQVFISYKWEEFSEADTVREILEQNGIACWMAPRNILPGSNYAREIPDAIQNCRIFLLMLSSRAQESQYVFKELDQAVSKGKITIPFLLEECPLNKEFDFLLSGAQRFAAFENKSRMMEKLVREIQAQLNVPLPPPPPPPPPPEDRTLRQKIRKLFNRRNKSKASVAAKVTAGLLIYLCVASALIGVVNGADHFFDSMEEQEQAEEMQRIAVDYGRQFLWYDSVVSDIAARAFAEARGQLETRAGTDSVVEDFNIEPFREEMYGIFVFDSLIDGDDADYIYNSAYDETLAIDAYNNCKLYLADGKATLNAIDSFMRMYAELSAAQKLAIFDMMEAYLQSIRELIAAQTNLFLLPLDAQARNALLERNAQESANPLLTAQTWNDDEEQLKAKVDEILLSIAAQQKVLNDDKALLDAADAALAASAPDAVSGATAGNTP